MDVLLGAILVIGICIYKIAWRFLCVGVVSIVAQVQSCHGMSRRAERELRELVADLPQDQADALVKFAKQNPKRFGELLDEAIRRRAIASTKPRRQSSPN